MNVETRTRLDPLIKLARSHDNLTIRAGSTLKAFTARRLHQHPSAVRGENSAKLSPTLTFRVVKLRIGAETDNFTAQSSAQPFRTPNESQLKSRKLIFRSCRVAAFPLPASTTIERKKENETK